MVHVRSIGKFVGGLIMVVFVSPCLIMGQQPPAIDLVPTSSTSTIYRVISRLDGRGTVSTDEDTDLDLHLDARFNYDERIIARKQNLKSVRDYQSARAGIRLGPGSVLNELASDHSILIVQTNRSLDPVKFAAIAGPLTQKEFELLGTPANTLTLPELLVRSGAKIGDTWSPEKARLANFLNIDLIGESDIQLKFEKLERGIAWLFISGKVNGMVDDSGTEIEISGTIQFDTELGFVRGCEISINQRRDIGRLAPGLDANFRISTRIAPITTSPRLTDEGLAKLRENTSGITDLLSMAPLNETIHLLHTRQWRVIGDQPQRGMLRYIFNGEMLGQCDILPLPPRPAAQPQTLEQFRQVVEAKLAEHNATITGSDQSTLENGIEWMRVTATGASNGVKLVWDYYTITHSDGRRVQLVFTTEPENASRFGAEFDSLISRISFPDASSARNAAYKK